MMNLPVIVDVGIGLVIIYISGALMVSGIQELIATILQWRSQHLKESILQIMLGQNVSNEDIQKAIIMREKIYENPIIQSMNHTSVSWISKLWNAGESYKTLYAKSLPSYIENENFATALIDELSKLKSTENQDDNNPDYLELKERENIIIQRIKEKTPNAVSHDVITLVNLINKKEIPNSLSDILISLASRAAIKVKEGENLILCFQKEIENWFNASMDRASGVYKRNTHLVSWILASIIVIFFNLDSVNIAQKLFDDSTLRNLLVENATTLVDSYKSEPSDPNSQLNTQRLEASINDLFDNNLPIVPLYENAANLMNCPDQDNCKLLPSMQLFSGKKFVLAVVGWMMTTLAIHMGAPFWFQLLNKFVNVRATGSKPEN